MNPTPGPSIGETWAYRHHGGDPLVQVHVRSIGSKRPARVLIRFVDAAFEGREEWVPPARLKAFWRDVDAFTAREQRWDAVVNAFDVFDTPEESAASVVFNKLIDEGLATLGYNATNGVVTIRDLEGLAAFLELDPDDLQGDALSFVEDGHLVAPWSMTLLIAKRAAERDPDPILQYVEREEADRQREGTYGKDYGRRGSDSWHISAEICAQTDEEHGRPVRDVLRRWCGHEATDRRDELKELRKEVLRLGRLAQSAVGALRRAGASREAASIERELGIPVEALRPK